VVSMSDSLSLDCMSGMILNPIRNSLVVVFNQELPELLSICSGWFQEGTLDSITIKLK